jgi:Domain of unknown function (DUF4190)
LALAAMILGIIGLVLCPIFVPSLLALIFGLVAAGQIKRSAGSLTGSGFARAGWVMGVVGLLVGAGFWVLGASGALDDGKTGVFDVEAGDCVTFDFDLVESEIPDEITTVEVVDCDEPHDAEVIRQGELNPDEDRDYPSNEVLIDESLTACGREDAFNIFTIVPNEASWDQQGGPYVCFEISG